MRRWRVINGGNEKFYIGDIITLCGFAYDSSPDFFTPDHLHFWSCNLERLVEIGESGNIIRIYRKDDHIDAGVLIKGVTMNKKEEAMDRLDAIEAEAKELRKILEKPDRLIFDISKIYVTNRSLANGSILIGPFIIKKEYESDKYQTLGFKSSFDCWTTPKSSAQEAIDYLIKCGFEVKEFTNQKDAFAYMLSQVVQ